MKSTTCVEDLVDAVEKETGIQEDSRRDWCGHLQPSQNIYTQIEMMYPEELLVKFLPAFV